MSTRISRRAVLASVAGAPIAVSAGGPPASEELMALPANQTSNDRGAKQRIPSPVGYEALELNNLALGEMLAGHPARAAVMLRGACEIWSKYCGAENVYHAFLLLNLADAWSRCGRVADADQLACEVLAHIEQLEGANSHAYSSGLKSVASVFANTNRNHEAVRFHQRALQIDEANFGPDDFRLAFTLERHGALLRADGRLDEAKAMHERARRIREDDSNPI